LYSIYTVILMATDKNAAKKALEQATRRVPMRPGDNAHAPPQSFIPKSMPRPRDPREELYMRYNQQGAGRPRDLEQISMQPMDKVIRPVSKIPANNAFPCEDQDIHNVLATYITTDGGGSGGADYYHNWFDSDADNLRNAAIQSSGSTWQIGYRPPPPVPVQTDTTNAAFQDIYIYFDSANKDQSSLPAQGLYIWSVSSLNNALQPITRIIEMEISNFHIQDILTPLTSPAYFFFEQVTLELEQSSAQAMFGPSGLRYHFEFLVEDAGISKLLLPKREGKYVFGIPLRELSIANFRFRAPTKTIVFNQDTYLDCSPINGTNPGVIDLGENHNLGGPGFIANPPNTITAVPGAAGVLGAGQYSWVVTFVVGATETSATLPGTIHPAGTFAALQANLSNIPIGPAGTTARRIYRTVSFAGLYPPGYFLVTTIADNVTTVFVDNTADGALGAALPLTNNTGTTTQVSIFVSGFMSDTQVDAIVNNVDGLLAQINGARTLALSNTTGADFDLGGSFPVTPVVPFKTVIGFRRITFSVRFRSLVGYLTNYITPV